LGVSALEIVITAASTRDVSTKFASRHVVICREQVLVNVLVIFA